MDLGFRRIGRGQRVDRARVDQQRLVAGLSARQAASPTARAMLAAAQARGSVRAGRAALVAVYAADPRWREAAVALGHAFRRAVVTNHS